MDTSCIVVPATSLNYNCLTCQLVKYTVNALVVKCLLMCHCEKIM